MVGMDPGHSLGGWTRQRGKGGSRKALGTVVVSILGPAFLAGAALVPVRPAAAASPPAPRTEAAAAGGAPSSSAAGAPSSALQRAWDQVVSRPALAHALIGADAYDVTTHRQLAAIHASWRLTPGSVTKLFTSAAGLADLGTGFRYRTLIELGPAPGGHAVYLVGGGDPFLEANDALDLEAMAKQVAPQLGTVTRVIGVSTLFRSSGPGTGWDYGDLGLDYAPNIAALTSERDEIQVTATPGAAVGDRPVVALNHDNPHMVLPPPSFLHIKNDATTAPSSAANTLAIFRPLGRNVVDITGRVPLGSAGANVYLSLHDPALLTATLFQRVLSGDGIHFSAPPTVGTLPAGSQLLEVHRSPPLSQYLQIQNTYSINQMAEHLWRMLGAVRSGVGTPATATAAVDAFLHRAHLSTNYVQVDGSGLSDLDEVSTSQVVALLRYVATQPWFLTFEHSLIHVGRTNQCSFLCGYMDHTAADGHVWLKTGNLANQWNYAGFAHARNGDLIVFALFFDGLNGVDPFDEAIKPIDQMTVDAASWPKEPAPSAASSRTTRPARSSGSARSRARLASGAPVRSSPGPMPAALRPLLAPVKEHGASSGAVVSAAVADVPSGRLVWSSEGQRLVRGGMLPRLATVGAALQEASPPAGAVVEATGTVVGHTLRGSIVLVGKEDALLDSAQLAALARDVATAGITRTTGPLEYARAPRPSFFGSPWPYDLPWEDIGQAWAPPGTALALDGGIVHIVVDAHAAGTAPSVFLVPSGIPVRVTNQARVERGGPPLVAMWVRGTAGYDLVGSIAPDTRRVLVVAPTDPGGVAAAVFRHDLVMAGVQVAGRPRLVATAPPGHPLGRAPSPSLAALASVALRDPSDLAPFDLYGLLGPRAGRDIANLTSPLDQVVDPAGVGAYDYVSADSFAQFLGRAGGNPKEASLTRLLSRPWEAQDAEELSVAGYFSGPRHSRHAFVIMVSGLPWSPRPDVPARLAPRILSW